VVSATFEPKLELNEQNLEVTGKFSSSNDISLGTSVRDLFTQGSKIELNVNKSDRNELSGVVLAGFKNNSCAFKAKVTYPFTAKKPIKLNTEAVVHHTQTNCNIGLGVDINLEGKDVPVFTEGVVAHSSKDTQYKGFVRYGIYDGSLNWGLSFWQKINRQCNWAFDILSENSTKITYMAGTVYKVDDYTSVQGKWKLLKGPDRNDYRFGASLKQKLSPYVMATLGTDLNPRSFFGSLDGEPHSFGLEIKLQD